MKIKYYHHTFFIILFSFAGSNYLKAQTVKPDTLNKPNKDTRNIKDIGYGTQDERIITGSVSTVKGDVIQKNFNNNLGNTLFGRLAGLTVNQGGTESGNNNPGLVARGLATFGGAGTNPLIIIDGFDSDITQITFNSLVPEEIESISLLKDAAATAVYGFRGANGVLLITTKHGKKGPLSVNFSTRQGFTQATDLPKFLNSYDYATLYNEALANDGKPALYTATDLAGYQNGTDPFKYPNVNWYNEVLRKSAPVSSYNLNFNGGTENVKYFVNLNALGNAGLFKKFGDQNSESSNSTYNKYNFRSNIDIKVSNTLSASFNLGGSFAEKSNPAAYNTSSTFTLLGLLAPNAFPVYNPDGSFARNSTYANPVGNLLNTGFYSSSNRTIQTSLRVTQLLDIITKGLSINAGATLNNYFSGGSAKSKTYVSYIPSSTGTLTPSGSPTSLVSSEPVLDQFRIAEFQGGLNYDRTFKAHHITAMALYSSGNYTISGNNPAYKHQGGAARLTYVNNDKYIAEFSAGYTGSENFPPAKRYGFFPAGSIGWIASNEGFLKSVSWVNFLKMRVSYGLSGNNDIGGVRFGYQQAYPQPNSYIFGTGTTTSFTRVEGVLANPNLTWEKDKKLNIGLDATLFKGLDFSLDLFKQDRYDILVPGSGLIPQYIGVTSVGLNEGKVSNKGFEAVLGYHNSGTKVGYFVQSNFAYAKNKIIYNAEALQLFTYRYTTGKQIGQPFGYQAIGFLTADEANPASPSKVATPLGIPVQAGDLKYQDQNSDGVIDANDQVRIGNTTTPNLTVGLHTGVNYKGFDLDVVVQGVSGRTVYLSGSYYQAFQNNGQAGKIALGRWTPATAATATYPRLSSVNNQNNFLFSSFYQRNGDFIKLRSAELGYTFNKRLVSKVKLSEFRLFITGTNLLSIDHIPDSDPETLSGYPPQRTITLGARVQL